MKYVLVLLLMTFSFSPWADESTDDPARPTLGKTGQLFVLKLTPKQRRLEVRLAGTPAAQLDPGRLEVFGRVFTKGGSGPTDLKIEAARDHFKVPDNIPPNAEVEIQVKDKTTNKSETLRLEQKTKP